MSCRSPRAAGRTGRTSSPAASRCNRRKGGRTPAEAGMHLLRIAEAARVGAGHPHYGRAAECARELARLPLLERRARRHVASSLISRTVPASPFRMPRTPRDRRSSAARDRRRPHHASTARVSRRPTPRLPEVRIGDRPRARRLRVADAARRPRARRDSRGGRDAGRASNGVAARRAFVDIAAPFATGLASGRQPGLRSRRQPLCHLQRHARPAGAGVDLSRRAPNGTRETFSSGIVNPTSMAIDADGRLYVSSRFEGTVYRLRRRMGSQSRLPPISASRAGSRSRRTGRCSSAIDRARSSRSIATASATTFASLPSSVAAFHLALGRTARSTSTGADAVDRTTSIYRIDRDGTVTRATAERSDGRRVSPSTRRHAVRRRGARRRERPVSAAAGRRAGARRSPAPA